MLFKDRREAGKRLAEELKSYAGKDTIVLALPRGGVVIGFEVAKALQVPLDVIITRKIGAPTAPEYAIGAVAENGEVLLNDEEIRLLGISRRYIDEEIRRQKIEIERRIGLYRGGKRLPSLSGKRVILVDDGIATGFTVKTSIRAVRAENPRELVLAVPVAPAEVIDELAPLVDAVVCLATPSPFIAVGAWYRSFEQTTDDEVRSLLDAARRAPRRQSSTHGQSSTSDL